MTTRSILIASFLLLASCLMHTRAGTSWASDITPDEARRIAKDAFVYRFAHVENYRSLYKKAVDSIVLAKVKDAAII